MYPSFNCTFLPSGNLLIKGWGRVSRQVASRGLVSQEISTAAPAPSRLTSARRADVITSLSRCLSRRRESSASDGSESTCSLDVWFKKTEFPYIFHRKSLITILHEFECLYRRQRVICRTDCPSPSNPRPQLAGAWTTTRGWM